MSATRMRPPDGDAGTKILVLVLLVVAAIYAMQLVELGRSVGHLERQLQDIQHQQEGTPR